MASRHSVEVLKWHVCLLEGGHVTVWKVLVHAWALFPPPLFLFFITAELKRVTGTWSKEEVEIVM